MAVRKNETKIIIIAALFACMLFLNGCGPTLGQIYQKADTVPENMGMVYIYRPSSFVGGGISYDVKVAETPVVTLYNGGYYPYLSKPGEVEFWAETESKSSVTLDIKAGESYYIKGTVGVGFIVGRPHLMLVSQEVAESEISKCKLIPEKNK